MLPAASHNGALNWGSGQFMLALWPSDHHLHLIIEIHISNNVSLTGQRRSGLTLNQHSKLETVVNGRKRSDTVRNGCKRSETVSNGHWGCHCVKLHNSFAPAVDIGVVIVLSCATYSHQLLTLGLSLC